MSDAVWSAWGPPVRVRLDASAIWTFARAVKDASPLYRSLEAATSAGFADLPAPPTFTFAMAGFGAWPDVQPPGGAGRLFGEDAGDLTSRRGLSLHGEQEFVYHRQPVAGEVLEGRMRSSQPWRKQGRRTMEFRLLETRWCDVDGSPVVDETITAVYLPTDDEL
jgi:hypothetical protein